MILIADTRSCVFITATSDIIEQEHTVSSILLLETVGSLLALDFLRHLLDLLHGIANVDNLRMNPEREKARPRPSAARRCRHSGCHLRLTPRTRSVTSVSLLQTELHALDLVRELRLVIVQTEHILREVGNFEIHILPVIHPY